MIARDSIARYVARHLMRRGRYPKADFVALRSLGAPVSWHSQLTVGIQS